MRATLTDIKAQISSIQTEWGSRIVEGETKRDEVLVIDASNCSAIAHNYEIRAKGNTLELTSRSGRVTVFKPLTNSVKVSEDVVRFIQSVEGPFED